MLASASVGVVGANQSPRKGTKRHKKREYGKTLSRANGVGARQKPFSLSFFVSLRALLWPSNSDSIALLAIGCDRGLLLPASVLRPLRQRRRLRLGRSFRRGNGWE